MRLYSPGLQWGLQEALNETPRPRLELSQHGLPASVRKTPEPMDTAGHRHQGAAGLCAGVRCCPGLVTFTIG